jgi:hypothetical protein
LPPSVIVTKPRKREGGARTPPSDLRVSIMEQNTPRKRSPR